MSLHLLVDQAAALPLAVPMATDNPSADFSDTPWWLALIKAVAVFVYLLLSTLLVIWFERRVIGRMQQRPGPNRTGPGGWLQSLADGLKLALKEEIIPAMADKPVYVLAPIVSAVPAFLAFSVIPLGPAVSIFGHRTALQLFAAVFFLTRIAIHIHVAVH